MQLSGQTAQFVVTRANSAGLRASRRGDTRARYSRAFRPARACSRPSATSESPATRDDPKSMILSELDASIRMFSGLRSWWMISLRWKARSPFAICSTMTRAVSRSTLGWSTHPLPQRLPLEELGDVVERFAHALRPDHLEHVRACDQVADPFLAREHLEIDRVVLVVDRRRLEHDELAARLVAGEIDLRRACSDAARARSCSLRIPCPAPARAETEAQTAA